MALLSGAAIRFLYSTYDWSAQTYPRGYLAKWGA